MTKTWRLLAMAILLSKLIYAKDVKQQVAIEGMTCDACAIVVKKALIGLKGVKSVTVDLQQGAATITYDDGAVTVDQLRQAINKTGFKSRNPQ